MLIKSDGIVCIFQDMPEILPLSSKVDLLLFLLSLKPAFRTFVASGNMTLIKSWCDKHEFSFESDHSFVYISSDHALNRRIKSLDAAEVPHAVELGVLLGYPKCCCNKIASIGEGKIDAYADWLNNQSFSDPYRIINTSMYSQGIALISHVPCSVVCKPSLLIAKKVLTYLRKERKKTIFSKWHADIEAAFFGSGVKTSKLPH